MIFLNRVILQTIDDINNEEYGKETDFKELAFVFPTRRAGLYFKKMLLESDGIKKPLLEPDIFSINDFVEELSEKKFPDNLTLIFELYEIYKRITGNTSKTFDRFYPWGKFILSDFNDISQNLVSIDVFKKLQEYSKYNDLNESGLIKHYNEFTVILEKLYSEFSEVLKKKGASYYGSALKEIIDRLNTDLNKIKPLTRWKKIIFAGFNFLTVGEERLLSILKKADRTIIYWDTDEYFLKDKDNEAGSFFRNSKLFKESPNWTDNILAMTEKKINIIGTPGKVGQAKITGKLLEKKLTEYDDLNPEETAVILADETLMLPTLNSLPESLKKINVSMGSPIKHSSPFNFIFLLLNIIFDYEDYKSFTRANIERILRHPYIFESYKDEILKFLNLIYENKKQSLDKTELMILNPVLRRFFNISESHFDNPFEYIKFLISFVKDYLIKNESSIDIEYLFELYNNIQRVQDIFAEYSPELNDRETIKIIKDSLENKTVPFSGEPLTGLQVLGMLETRALDFENIYILSVNEKIFPKDKSVQTLIPTEVRKLFGMSYYEKRDGIFAYYFYRLIKGANNISLIYNTENDNLGKGERSRFIDQLLYEFNEKNRKTLLSEKIYTVKSELSASENIIIDKTDEIFEKLKKIKYSASSVNRYLYCELAFYFRYIAGISELDTDTDLFDPKNFGTIIHRILEKTYSPFINREIKVKDIDNIILNIEKIVTEFFAKDLNINNSDRGRNHINKSIIVNILKKFFLYEKTQLPISIEALEKKYTNEIRITVNKEVVILKLKGTIDRIDRQNEFLRIIDYKTGKMSSLNNIPDTNSSTEYIIERLKKSKEILQLSFYNYLLKNDNEYKKEKNTKYGIVFFKSLSKGTLFIRKDKDDHNIDKEAENILIKILQDIFNKNKKFTQTENKDNCKNCPYKDICLS